MASPGSPIRVCFVCLGNICRSPTAEAIFRQLVAEAKLEARIESESAATAAFHVGERPDRRSRETARAHGVRLDGRATSFGKGDFARFDYVLAMDAENERDLLELAPSDAERRKIARLRSFEPRARSLDVPDPYYGGERGFERVFGICQAACRGLLAHLVAEHQLR